MRDEKNKPFALQKLESISDNLTKICFLVAGVALVAMTVFFAWLVFGRYVLNDTPTWVEQVGLLLVMVIAFFGAAAGVHQDTHLSVIIFRAVVPSWLRSALVILTDLMMIVFGGMMFWYGVQLTQFKWNTLIPLIQISEGFRSLPLTICGALIFLFSIGHLARLLLGFDKRTDDFEEGL
ncbi:MAG: TRAP transporter small permease [Nitratireductor sp.]